MLVAMRTFARGVGSEAILRVGSATAHVEIAKSEREVKRGLMHRTSLAEDAGMLFIFRAERVRYFWMKNTPIDLDAAFIDRTGRITEIVPLEKNNREIVESQWPAQYVLEMNRDWFASNGAAVGDQVACSGAP